MPQVEHVQIAVPDGEAGTCVRAVAYARAQADARPGLKLNGYRHLVFFGVLFFRCDDDLFEALGVAEVTLGFAETGIGKDIAGSVSKMTAQETVRIVGRALDARSTEIILLTRIQDQFDGGGCGGFFNADFVP